MAPSPCGWRHVGHLVLARAGGADSRATLIADDLAIDDAHGAISLGRDLGVMGDHDDGVAGGIQPAEHRQDLGPGAGVEIAGRLIGEDQARSAGQAAGDRHTLHLAAGQLHRGVAETLAETEAGGQRCAVARARAASSPA